LAKKRFFVKIIKKAKKTAKIAVFFAFLGLLQPLFLMVAGFF